MTHHFFPQQAKTMPRSLTLFIALLALLATHAAWALDPAVRRDILDTIRPAAATRAGQEVRIVVDTLNVDGDWALLAGSLVGKDNRPMKVELAKECSQELDRLLFAVLTRRKPMFCTVYVWATWRIAIPPCKQPDGTAII